SGSAPGIEQLADQETDAERGQQARDRPLLELAADELLGGGQARARPLADFLERLVAPRGAEILDPACDRGDVAAERLEVALQLVDVGGEVRGCRCHRPGLPSKRLIVCRVPCPFNGTGRATRWPHRGPSSGRSRRARRTSRSSPALRGGSRE